MAVMELWRRRDLEGTVKPEYVDGNFFTQDSVGNLVGVKVYKDGAEVALTGSVTGYCVLPSGETVSVAGTRSGNQASILVPQSALAYTGPLGIVLKLIDGNTITTMLSIIVVVYRSKTDTVITPSSQIITDWANQISAALQEVEDASAAQDVKIADLKSAIVNRFGYIDIVWHNGNLQPSGVTQNATAWYSDLIPIKYGDKFYWENNYTGTLRAYLYSGTAYTDYINNIMVSNTQGSSGEIAIEEKGCAYIRLRYAQAPDQATVESNIRWVNLNDKIADEFADIRNTVDANAVNIKSIKTDAVGAEDVGVTWIAGRTKYPYGEIVSTDGIYTTGIMKMPEGGISVCVLNRDTSTVQRGPSINMRFFKKSDLYGYINATDYAYNEENIWSGLDVTENPHYLNGYNAYFPYEDGLFFAVNVIIGSGDSASIALPLVKIQTDTKLADNYTRLLNIAPVYDDTISASKPVPRYVRGASSTILTVRVQSKNDDIAAGTTENIQFFYDYTWGMMHNYSSILPLREVKKIVCSSKYQLQAAIYIVEGNAVTGRAIYASGRTIYSRVAIKGQTVPSDVTAVNQAVNDTYLFGGVRVIDLSEYDSDGYVMLTISPQRRIDTSGNSASFPVIQPMGASAYDDILRNVHVIWNPDVSITFENGGDDIVQGNVRALEHFTFPCAKGEINTYGDGTYETIPKCDTMGGILYDTGYNTNCVGYNVPFAVYAKAAQNPNSRYYQPETSGGIRYGIQCSNFAALMLGLTNPEKSQYYFRFDEDTAFDLLNINHIDDIDELQAGDELVHPGMPHDGGHCRMVIDKAYINGKLFCVNIAEAWAPVTQRIPIIADSYFYRDVIRDTNSFRNRTFIPKEYYVSEYAFPIALRFKNSNKKRLSFPSSVPVYGDIMCDRGTDGLYTPANAAVQISKKTTGSITVSLNGTTKGTVTVTTSTTKKNGLYVVDIKQYLDASGRYTVTSNTGSTETFWYFIGNGTDIVESVTGNVVTFKSGVLSSIKYLDVYYYLDGADFSDFRVTHVFPRPTGQAWEIPIPSDLTPYGAQSVRVGEVYAVVNHQSGNTYAVQMLNENGSWTIGSPAVDGT